MRGVFTFSAVEGRTRGLLAGLGLTLAVALVPAPARAQETLAEGIWSITVPNAFPGRIFTWRVAADGTYREDARQARTGTRVQNTVSGHWSLQGLHLVLRQDDEAYVFDGVVSGGCFIGRLSLHGRDISSFTARRRGSNVRRCDGDTTV